jgi:hypothetical protein
VNANEFYPSRFLKADDFPMSVDTPVTISSVDMEILTDGTKPVVSFSDQTKGLVLNKTNCDAIVRLYGPDTANWTGKRIALYKTEVQFKGETRWGIRVRLTAPATQPTLDQAFAGAPQ